MHKGSPTGFRTKRSDSKRAFQGAIRREHERLKFSSQNLRGITDYSRGIITAPRQDTVHKGRQVRVKKLECRLHRMKLRVGFHGWFIPPPARSKARGKRLHGLRLQEHLPGSGQIRLLLTEFQRDN